MDLLVLKFGGTSVGTVDRIKEVAAQVASLVATGQKVAVVLSAMTGQTDKLEALARDICTEPTRSEVDVLLATGEQVTVAMLAIALEGLGLKAQSFMGWQVPIITDSQYGKARILDVSPDALLECIKQGVIPVISGFQGVDALGRVTTLGRGGSDTTAVAIAVALKARECQIFTDVDGVYTTDPRIEPEARRMTRMTFEEMLELSSLGSKVLQSRSVEFAAKYGTSLRVLSTFMGGSGTLIAADDGGMEQPAISGIAVSKQEAKLTLDGIPEDIAFQADILGPIAAAGIPVDMVVQNVHRGGCGTFILTIVRSDYEQAKAILEDVAKTLGASTVYGDDRVVKISLVGVGMRSHVGVASKMCQVLGRENIPIQLISASEIKVSVIVDERYLELGVRALHTAFDLDRAPLAGTRL